MSVSNAAGASKTVQGSRKLLLRCFLSPGDIVMLSAAVRDLHLCYPGQFITDVRTSCPDLWEHNPHLVRLSESAPDVEVIDCEYPLIDHCNGVPYHCLHGFIQFLNRRLGLQIQPTAFAGEIHISRREKSWHSQAHELTGADTPFWILAAGGKYDIPIKWWETARYQQVVDHFQGRIQFVQVGARGHHHPPLRNIIDLRGKTTLRQLVRLVYHAQGIVCPVTSLMHLSAAIECRPSRNPTRPCVVIAGGREPAHWEAYPDHQFISTNGTLPCCSGGGCWKARVFPLGDGDLRDEPVNLCSNVVDALPRCMDLISSDEVIRRIELYFQGGVCAYLTPREAQQARRAVVRTRTNDFDSLPLRLQNARMACDRYVERIPRFPSEYAGRGIVICGGGLKYFPGAWVCIQQLRRLGCTLPIELWHLGKAELPSTLRRQLQPLGVRCVDAESTSGVQVMRHLGGWELKPFAMVHSRFREMLLLDADNLPVRNPEYLFTTPQYRQTGALFWPDYGRFPQTRVIWESCGIPQPEGPEFESGQIVMDKKRCWKPLRLALWFNAHSDFYYQHLHGDKETFHLAFHRLRKSYGFVDISPQPLDGTMCQHDFDGARVFQHRNGDKWALNGKNRQVPDFWFEEECRESLRNLQGLLSRQHIQLRNRRKRVAVHL